MKTKNVLAGLALALTGVGSAASAAPIYTASTDAESLATATLAPGSGINIVAGSETYQGGVTQGGTFSDFSYSNSSTSVAIDDGVVLTSGDINDIPDNDSSSISANPGAGSDSDLQSLTSQTVTEDANVLTFDFTVNAGITSVSMDFIFGTDEFPDQTVTDIFGVFVDGVNYAKFDDGSLVSFDLGSPAAGSFIDNDFGSSDPLLDDSGNGLEYDGIINSLTMDGLLNTSLTTHSIKIAIGDTNDTIFDSGVFVSGLTAGTETGGGIDSGDPAAVQVPATAPLILTGLAILGFLRRRTRS